MNFGDLLMLEPPSRRPNYFLHSIANFGELLEKFESSVCCPGSTG